MSDQFTTMGTNVNMASGLQEFAKGDQIIISNTTMEMISSKGFDLKRISVGSNNPLNHLKTLIAVMKSYFELEKKRSIVLWGFFLE
ncbi:hypothetical protein [Candidatus Nitrosocosmicus sp. R]